MNAQTLTVQPAVSISDVNNSLPVAIAVAGPNIATGTVTLIGGGYNSGAQTLDHNAEYLFTIPPNSLSVGTDTLTVSYSGDTNYAPFSKSVTIKVAASVPLRVSVIGPVATQVAAGTGHTCVLTAASITTPETIQCWGSNSHGQLGNGTTTDTTLPVQVDTSFYQTINPTDVPVVALAVGDNHTCALRPSTSSYGVDPICWGANASGQLGNGSNADSSTPVLVPINDFTVKAAAIAAGSAHTCVLLDDGSAQCWGDNSHGQLGDGTVANSTSPVTVSGLSNAIAIAAGGNHTCALLTNDTVVCWGENGNGQLGNSSIKDSSTPVAVAGLGGSATLLALGGTHSCALLTDGTLKCWGGNAHGQLGNSSITDSSTPVAVSGVVGATTVAAGGLHTCAVVAAGGGTVQCWGSNADGQLGDNTITDRTVPVHTGTLSNVTALTLGGSHTCAQNAVGVLSCWGDNATGQLGNATKQAGGVLSPLPVNGMGGIAATVSTGGLQACSITAGGTANLGSGGTLKTNGAPFCWGQNGGDLGNGSTQPSSTPVEVLGLGDTVKTLYIGGLTSCAILIDGSVDCWGGDVNTVKSLTPVKITGFSGTVLQLSISPYAICALISNGTVQCWGNNYYGELGDGTINNSATPVTVVGVSGATAISGRQYPTCALISGGTVECWGDGASGLTSAGVSGVTAVSAGQDFNCVLLADKTVECWGLNTFGQLGNGTTSSNPTGVGPVVGLSGVAQLSAGAEHTCALLSDTTVKCWGYNNEGELGNGTTTISSTPVKVVGLTGVNFISSGDGTTLALVSDGTLQGWGSNDAQQLGDSTGMSSTNLELNQYVLPVPVFEGQSISFNPPPSEAVGSKTDLVPLTTGSSDLSATFDAWTIANCEIDYNASGTALTVLNSKQPLLCGVRASQSGGYNLYGGSLAPAASQQHSVAVGASFLAPLAALSPTSLAFGSIAVGDTSPAQTLTLSNSGSASLSITGISITGLNASQFKETTTCTSTLAAGANCTISLTFTPTTPASAVATVAVADNAAGSPQTASLSGTGTAPAAPKAALTPASVTFGSITVGSFSAAQTFTLTNAGTATLPITSTGISGSGAAAFKIASNTCGASLAAGANCNITVTFKPSAAGAASATLSVNDSVGAQSANLTGTGVALPPALAVAPSPLNFGTVNVGGTKGQSVEIVNLSSTPVSVQTISSSDPAVDVSLLSTSCSGKPLAVGMHCLANVRFTPTAAKSYSATITLGGIVATGCGGCTIAYPNQTLAAIGTGVVAPPALALSASPINFGNVIVGGTKGQSVEIVNLSSTPVTIKTISSSDPAIDVSLLSTSCSGKPLAVGMHCLANVRFTPTAAKSYSATITFGGIVATGCGGCTIAYPNQTIAVTGTGVMAPPALAFAPSPVSFGTVIVGGTKVQSVDMVNLSSTPILIGTISSSDPAIDVSLLSSSCTGKPLATGVHCDAVLRFKPTAVKSYSATITLGGIVATGCGGCVIAYPNQAITITGTGVVAPPALTLSASPINFGSIIIGATGAKEVEIVNLSSTPVSIETISSSDPAIDVSLLSTSCSGKLLAVGMHCLANVRFTPTAVKSYSGTITLGGIVATGCGGCSIAFPNQTLAAIGTGAASPPALDVTPSISFGSVIIGGTGTKGVEIVNISSTPVSIKTISSSDPAIDVSLLSTSCSGKPLAVGMHCLANVRFTPTAAKNYSATITLGGIVATGCGGCSIAFPNQTIAATGVGVAPTPALAITPSPVNFGGEVLGQTATFLISLANVTETGVLPKTITSSDPAFNPNVATYCSTTPIPAKTVCGLEISFAPTVAKSYSATITLKNISATDCGGCTTVYPDQTFTVTGTGTAPPTSIIVTPSPVNFGGEVLGQTTTFLISLANVTETGVLPKTITSSDPAFNPNVSTYCSTNPIPAKTVCGLEISFAPTVAKSYSATIRLKNIIATDCGGCTTVYPDQTFTVTGTGVAPTPALTITPSPLNFGNVLAGQTTSIEISLANVTETGVLAQTIVSSDPAFNTSLSPYCTTSPIPFKSSCGLIVSFTPTSAKSYSATLMLKNIIATACGGCTTTYPNQTLAVTGTGFLPDPPAFSPSGGTFASKQSVTLGDATFGSTIYFTVDGSTPTVSSPVYSSPIQVSSTATIRAIAVLGGVSSTVSSASYTINPAGCQTVNYSSGFSASGLSLNGGAAINGTALELTDGGLSEARSAFFSTALPTTSYATDFTFQITDPLADGMTFTIQSNNPNVVGYGGGGLGYAGIPNSVAIKVDLHNNAGEGTDSTGTYIDGAYPSIPAINLGPAGIDLHSGHIFAVHLAYASGLTKATIKDTVTGVSATMNFPGDITTVVGNSAWFGFTAGTGGKSATQKILTWSYSGGPGCPTK
ncbi:choice-of-anchor D domain-containing protein [Granulicella aggregans]|uniref:RCC1 domain-containing protein n=1 Tax=Granulicella aggregans TaxID=474949 RepID=UPI001C85AFF9